MNKTVKIWSKSDKKWGRYEILNICNFYWNISWTVVMNMQISELMMSSPLNFPLYFVHRNDENPIFQLWESETCLISTLNKCRIMFALIYFDLGTFSYMFEQNTENFQNCYRQTTWTIVRRWDHQLNQLHIQEMFKKCFVENNKNSKLPIFLICYPLSIEFSLFYLKCFTLSTELTKTWIGFPL